MKNKGTRARLLRRKAQGDGEVAASPTARRGALYGLQEGRCHPGWGCGGEMPLRSLEEAHLRGLQMGGDRRDPGDSRNAASNRVLLCHRCHRNQEAVVARMHFGWMAGRCDWIEPTADNAGDVWREVEKLNG